MQSEHPLDESDTVIQNGRVLGGLEPSRAFGDARYKWPAHVQPMSVFTLHELIDRDELRYEKPDCMVHFSRVIIIQCENLPLASRLRPM